MNAEITATETRLSSLQVMLTALDKQVTDAQTVLRNLEAQKKQNRDAIAAQKATVTSLQAKLGDVQNQIKAIDATIALGGCVA